MNPYLIRLVVVVAILLLTTCHHSSTKAVTAAAPVAPSVALQQVVLHGNVTSNGSPSVLVDGLPATISGGTWSATVTLISRPQSVVVELLTNGLPVAQRVITIQ
ncbi:MAG: hypothetical protein H0V44_14580 [Planctomycetes bacterium]|nr:hypothetical protein [Planctomycetota bacterium]